MFINSSTHSESLWHNSVLVFTFGLKITNFCGTVVYFLGGGDLKMVKGCKSSQSNDGRKKNVTTTILCPGSSIVQIENAT